MMNGNPELDVKDASDASDTSLNSHPLIQDFAKIKLAVFKKTAILTFSIGGVLGVSAYYLDQYLGTFPNIFVASLLIGFFLSQVLSIKQTRRLTKASLESYKSV